MKAYLQIFEIYNKKNFDFKSYKQMRRQISMIYYSGFVAAEKKEEEGREAVHV